MTVELTTEQESQLSQLAAQAGRGIDELAQEAVDRYLVEEKQFQSAVRKGQRDADNGRFVATADVWARVEAALKA